MSNIEISNITKMNKGALILTCTVKIVPWGIKLHEVRFFEKGQNNWIGMPAKSWKTGENWEYKDLVEFVDNETKERFRKIICEEIMKKIEKGIDESPEFDEQCPF